MRMAYAPRRMGAHDRTLAGMDRRTFGRAAGVAALGTAIGGATEAAAPRRRALMKAGTQHDSSDATLAVLAALGVNNICSLLPSPRFDESWSVDGLRRLRERVESFGLRLDCVPLPLSSLEISRAENPNLMLGRSPEREREMDDDLPDDRKRVAGGHPGPQIQHEHPRRGAHGAHRRPGRRPLQHVFVRESADRSRALTEAGPVPADVYWERIT